MWHWINYQWITYWWSSDKGNGPENVQWTVLALIAVALIVPPVRHYLKREFDKIHHKMDHILSGSEEKYVEPEWEEFEHWVVTFGKWITKPFRRAP